AMNQTSAVWLSIASASVSANSPFSTERVFAVSPWKRGGADAVKPFWMRSVEVSVFYSIVGASGFTFESVSGNRFAQTWEFYAITSSSYSVSAYPGFVYRYSFKRHPRSRT
ncbi:hypothetical protein OY671_013135, partial [Metschnikowia pulcherrima]